MHTTERIPRTPHAGSNFERATARMQARGCRPFQPDLNHGRAERVLRDSTTNPEPAALPIDRIVGAVGVAGGVVLVILLLAEQFIAWMAS